MPDLATSTDWTNVPTAWYSNSTTYHSPTSATADTVWTTWLNTTSTTISTTLNEVWGQWNATTVRTAGSYQYERGGFAYRGLYDYTAPPETEQQRAERMQREADARHRRERELADRAEAEQKAKVILEENLTPEQRKQYQDNKWFEVITAKGRYRIRTGWAGNVERLDEGGRPAEVYCIHPSEWVPHEDNMLAQKLMLEYDEESFLRIANRSRPWR